MTNGKKDTIAVLLVAIVIMTLVLGTITTLAEYDIWNLSSKISTAQLIELIITLSLVLITAIYVKRTSDIAEATKEQAEETKAQRYTECLPVLIPIIGRGRTTEKTLTLQGIVERKLEPKEIFYELLDIGMLNITWRNLGKGVAINTRFSCWSVPTSHCPKKALFFTPQEYGALGIEEQKEIVLTDTWNHESFHLLPDYRPRIEAEYQDIYERKITTVQEIRIEEHGESKRAFLGDLYFTINGRRLGAESIKGEQP